MTVEQKERARLKAREKYWLDVEKSREYYRHKAREYKSRRCWVTAEYGITQEQWNAMKVVGCGICSATKDLVVDHCHTTQRVRGALCRTCNVAIGLLKDSPDILAKAILWLHPPGETV